MFQHFLQVQAESARYLDQFPKDVPMNQSQSFPYVQISSGLYPATCLIAHQSVPGGHELSRYKKLVTSHYCFSLLAWLRGGKLNHINLTF